MKFRVEKARDKQAVVAYLDRLPEGKAYDVTVVRHRERRSVDQNRLLWLWIKCISDETGQDKDDLHEYFKQKFLGFDTKTLWGTILYRPVSSSALDSLQFTQYLEHIRAFASSELGIELPNPEDQYWDQFEHQYDNKI